MVQVAPAEWPVPGSACAEGLVVGAGGVGSMVVGHEVLLVIFLGKRKKTRIAPSMTAMIPEA